jgi:putative ABC transport system permease protein
VNRGSWRIALRLARRDARRRPWRTALVMVLIALPVAGLVVGTGVLRTDYVSDETLREWQLGQADARLGLVGGSDESVPSPDDVIAGLPAGSRALTVLDSQDVVPDRRGDPYFLPIEDTPLADPMMEGRRLLRRGTAPNGPNEIAVSPAVLGDTGLDVGDSIRLARLGRDVRITGTVINPEHISAPLVIVGAPITSPSSNISVFVDLPPGMSSGVLSGDGTGFIESPFAMSSPRDSELEQAAVAYILGGTAMVVAAIIIAAAFAVGARRQLRDLGLLSAVGADPARLTTVVVAQGAVLGALGAAAGIVLGLFGCALLAPHMERFLDHVSGGFDVVPLDLVVALVLGVATSLAAAAFPARTASRIPTLAALAGRRPLEPVPPRLPIAGVVLAGAGLVAIAGSVSSPTIADSWQVALAGAVAVLLGGTATTPWLVGRLEPFAGRVRGMTRLAARGLARQRGRSGATAAAVMAAAALAVGGSTIMLSQEARDRRSYEPRLGTDQVLLNAMGTVPFDAGISYDDGTTTVPQAVVADVVGLLGDPIVANLGRVVGTTGSPVTTEIALNSNSAELGELIGGGAEELAALAAPAGAAHVLERRGVVGLGDRTETRTMRLMAAVDTGAQEAAIDVPILESERPELRVGLQIVMTPAKAAELGYEIRPGRVLVRNAAPLTREERRAVVEAVDAHNPRNTSFEPVSAPQTFVYAEIESSYVPDSQAARAVFVAFSLLFSLLVVGIGLALAATEGAAERALLTALGAPPTARRRVTAHQAALLALLGGLLAIPFGFGPGAVVVAARDVKPIVFPFSTVFALAVVVPALVWLVTYAMTALATRRAPSMTLLTAD